MMKLNDLKSKFNNKYGILDIVFDNDLINISYFSVSILK